MKLYKYRCIDKYTIRTISLSELWFAAPACFNDPFDCNLSFDPTSTREEMQFFLMNMGRLVFPGKSEHEIEQEVNRQLDILKVHHNQTSALRLLEAGKKGVRETVGVYCCSKRKDSILMWSHYADAHKGICLEFDTEVNPSDPFFSHVYPVSYHGKYPSISIRGMTSEQVTLQLVLSKADEWAYEEEYRLFAAKPGLGNFTEGSLTGIIFGCRCSDADKELVMALAQKRATVPAVYQARTMKDHFKVEVVRP